MSERASGNATHAKCDGGRRARALAGWFRFAFVFAVAWPMAAAQHARAASWADTNLQTSDTVEFATGIEQASEVLCVSLAPDVDHTEAHRAAYAGCRSSMEAILEGHFDRPSCRQGGLYIAPLDSCLDAIVLAMLEGPSCAEGNGDAARLHLHAAIADACSPDEICFAQPTLAELP